jgi:phage antirepressor YoqD-like protein
MGAAGFQLVTKAASGELVTTTAIIADGTEVQHKNVIELVRTYLADFKEFGGVAFQTQPFTTAGGTQAREVALLNEHQATLLITYMRNSEIVRAFKKALVRAFYEAKAALVSALPDFTNPAVAARAWAEQFEAKLALSAQIAADAPKVAFAEAVRSVDGVCHIEKIAKTLGIGRNKFFKRLRDDGILMGTNLPYQKYIDREYFTVIEQTPYTDKEGVKHPTFTPMVTGAGQVFLARRYSPVASARG